MPHGDATTAGSRCWGTWPRRYNRCPRPGPRALLLLIVSPSAPPCGRHCHHRRSSSAEVVCSSLRSFLTSYYTHPRLAHSFTFRTSAMASSSNCPSDNTLEVDQSTFWDADGINWDAHRIGWVVAGACAAAVRRYLVIRSIHGHQQRRQRTRNTHGQNMAEQEPVRMTTVVFGRCERSADTIAPAPALIRHASVQA